MRKGRSNGRGEANGMGRERGQDGDMKGKMVVGRGKGRGLEWDRDM